MSDNARLCDLSGEHSIPESPTTQPSVEMMGIVPPTMNFGKKKKLDKHKLIKQKKQKNGGNLLRGIYFVYSVPLLCEGMGSAPRYAIYRYAVCVPASRS